jgi:hypothetical protein
MRSRALILLPMLACFVVQASSAQASGCPQNSDAYSRAVLADSPVAYYRLDESAGPTMCDSSTQANNGTYNSSGIAYGAAGALASGDPAITADGSTAPVGQSGADPSGLTGNHAFTLEAWFKSATTSPPTNANSWLVGIGGTGGTGQADVLSLNPNHGSQLGWGPSSAITIDQYGSDFAWDPSTVSVNLWDGKWHYIAVTYTPSSSPGSSASQYVGYVDGHDLGNPEARPYGNAVTNIAASPIILGNGCSSNGCYWTPLDGSLDEVAVYSTPLSPTRIAAHYTAASETTQTLTVSRVGQGTVTSSPAGISCGTTCTDDFPSGTTVTLSAKPAYGSKFTSWSGACTGTGTCRLTMTATKTTTATFKIVPPPNTSITGHSVSSAKRSATFEFKGSGGVGTLHFQCKLDSEQWKSCTSPKTYTGLARGSHTFEVRAIDARGKADPVPAKHTFTI